MTRLGYSKKGWTDGEISTEWIKQFDQATSAKAAGRARLLLVDGHNSHYTLGFLRYAREHNIHVLCYPANATHIYQGLDVVVFGQLKRVWSETRDQWQRELGRTVTKENFLQIYGEVHLKVLTPELIKLAFEKTGIWPFNPDFVTPEMMAPAAASTCHTNLPLQQPSPVRRIASLFINKPRAPANAENGTLESFTQTPTRIRGTVDGHCQSPRTPSRTARNVLSDSAASWLTDPAPIASSSRLPSLESATFSPPRKRSRYQALLEDESMTERERELRDALRETEEREVLLKEQTIKMQSMMVLQNLHCERLCNQLATSEEKGKEKKGKGKGRLMTDGLPKLLTGDKFFNRVVAHVESQETEARERAAKRQKREQYGKVLQAWVRDEEERKARNTARREKHKASVSEWERARDAAREEKRRVSLSKPVLGRLEKAVPRPKFKDLPGADSDESEESDEGSDGDDD